MPDPEIDWEDLGATYGFSAAFLNAHKELKRIVMQAVKEDRSDAWITANVRETDWYRQTSEAFRKVQVLKATDPAEYQSQVDAMERHVRNVYIATTGHAPSAKWTNVIGQRAVNHGWTDEQLQNVVHQGARISQYLKRGDLGGEAGDLEDKMRGYARDMGVEVSDSRLAKWIANSVQSGLGEQPIQNAILRMAKSQYSAFADDLEGGVTMRDIAEPYIQMMAKELEIAPSQLGLDHKMIQQALARRVTDKDGKSHGSPMTLWEFQKTVRNDPRWDNTQGAQDSLMSIGHDVLKQMGVAS